MSDDTKPEMADRGYRELAAKVAKAESERNEARAALAVETLRVERLRADVLAYDTACNAERFVRREAELERDEARAEVERLRKSLEDIATYAHSGERAEEMALAALEKP